MYAVCGAELDVTCLSLQAVQGGFDVEHLRALPEGRRRDPVSLPEGHES